jgi:hypothetical protein
MSALYDPKAVKILFDTHWSSKGWRDPSGTPPADLAYAISKGVMFPPMRLSPGAKVRLVRKLCAALKPSVLGDAFLASLSTRELALRSALGSFAVGRHLPAHRCKPFSHTNCCRICGLEATTRDEDLNVLNFERLKWGGTRHTAVDYQILDLQEFQKLSPPRPSAEDGAIFQKILATVRSLPAKATSNHLEKALTGLFPSTKDERRQLIQILGLCGVLSYPGYRHHFDYDDPPKGRSGGDSDWIEPADSWRGVDGYNLENLREYFPKHLPTM